MKPTPISPSLVRHKIERTKLKSRPMPNRALAATRKAENKRAPSIELYQREDCEFSHSVRRRLTDLSLDFIAHNIPRGNAIKHEQLVQVGGKDETPLLVDRRRGVKLYDSAAIISYLDAEYGPPEPNRVVRVLRSLRTRLLLRSDQIRWQIRKPIDKAGDLRRDARDVVETVAGSYRVLRDVVREAVIPPRTSARRAKSVNGNGARRTKAAA
jgi:glutaredoxin